MEREKKLARFKREVQPHFDSVFGYAYMLTKDKFSSQDLAQEVFKKAFEKLDSLRENSNPKAWLITITRNTFYNTQRGAHKTSLEEDWTELERSMGTQSSFDGALFYNNMKELLESPDLGDQVRMALENLHEKQSDLVYLVLAQDFSYREAAEALETTENNLRTRLHRLRNALKAQLAEYAAQEYNIH